MASSDNYDVVVRPHASKYTGPDAETSRETSRGTPSRRDAEGLRGARGQNARGSPADLPEQTVQRSSRLVDEGLEPAEIRRGHVPEFASHFNDGFHLGDRASSCGQEPPTLPGALSSVSLRDVVGASVAWSP